jgi:endoglucanase
MNPWIEKVSAAEQDKTLQLLRAVVSTAFRRNLSVDVVLFAPAREIVCEAQNRDLYRAGLNAVLAELPDRPDFGIEVLSEPPNCPNPSSPATSWEATQEELYRTVRSMKRHLFFVVAGAGWGAVDGLLRLDPNPYGNDPNTMFTFHYYEPFLYTHQEVAWLRADHINTFVSDLAWPVESTNTGQARENALARLAGDKTLDDNAHSEDRKILLRLFAEYSTQGTTGYMSSRFQAVADWASAHNLSASRILLGEFGVHRQMAVLNLVAQPWPTASLWLSQVRGAAESRQMGWVVWDLDSGFGVICGSQAEMGELCPSYRTLFGE